MVYDSGPAFTLGEIEVEGLERYPRTLVDRYSRIEPGARYSQDVLLELQRNLQNTPDFASGRLDVDADPAHPHAVPIRVRVAEARAKRLSFGAGYSTNYGPRGEVTWRDANILDRGWQLSSGFRIDRLGHLAFADIHLPPSGGDYRDSFGVLTETNDNQGLKTMRHGVGVVRARVKGKIETRLSLNFERERRSVHAGETSQLNALVLNYGWTHRDVDNLLDPRDGLVFHVQLGGATRLLLSDQNFVRGLLRVQKICAIERDMLTVRAEAGWVAARSREGVPSDFLFCLAESVRGYAYHRASRARRQRHRRRALHDNGKRRIRALVSPTNGAGRCSPTPAMRRTIPAICATWRARLRPRRALAQPGRAACPRLRLRPARPQAAPRAVDRHRFLSTGHAAAGQRKRTPRNPVYGLRRPPGPPRAAVRFAASPYCWSPPWPSVCRCSRSRG